MRRVLFAYVVLVAAATGAMMWRLPGPAATPAPSKVPATTTQNRGSNMQWSQVQDVTVPAKPTGVWTWAVDYVKGPARILIEAAAGGTWVYSAGRAACGADGDLGALLSPNSTILPSAPTGALLVKIGGSTAGVSDGTVRVAGSKAYIEVDGTVSGPVFLTINDEVGGMSDNTGDLKVKVSISAIQASAATPAAPAGASDATPTQAPANDAAAGTKAPDAK